MTVTFDIPENVSIGDCQSSERGRASDPRLVEETRKGDNAAFGELVRRYEQRLRRTLRRFVFDRDTSDDLVQETFLKAYAHLDQFDPARRFGPWLFRIGVNLALDHQRKTARRGRLHFFGEHVEENGLFGPSIDDPRTVQETQQEVRALLDELPETYRTVLVLRDLENFSVPEIAALIGRKESTVRWRLSEARNRFEVLWHARQSAA